MVDSDGVPIHPSVIDGRTDEYAAFLETWGEHCGAPRSVFRGHLNCLIRAELQLAGADVVRAARAMLRAHRPTERALARLLTDICSHLLGHDCGGQGCADRLDAGTPICPERVALAARIVKARTVLGLDEAGS